MQSAAVLGSTSRTVDVAADVDVDVEVAMGVADEVTV